MAKKAECEMLRQAFMDREARPEVMERIAVVVEIRTGLAACRAMTAGSSPGSIPRGTTVQKGE
jgi:hypothetical protein